jgi:hypothetical protein
MNKEEILSLALHQQQGLAILTDSPKILDILADVKDHTMRTYIASNVYVSVETLWKLYYEEPYKPYILNCIIANPNAPEELVLEWNAKKWVRKKPPGLLTLIPES